MRRKFASTHQESRLGVLNLLFRTIDRYNVRTTLTCGEGDMGVSFRLNILDVYVFLSKEFTVELMRD